MRRVWLGAFVGLFALGCASHQYRLPKGSASAPEPVPVANSQGYKERETEKPNDLAADKNTGGEIQLTGPLAGAPAVRAARKSVDFSEELDAVQQTFGGGGTAPSQPSPPPAPTPIEVGAKPAAAEMIDIEAHVELEVEKTDRAISAIRGLVTASGGRVVNEVIEDKSTSAGAALSLRVPVQNVQNVLNALTGVGKVLSRKVESKDVGREYHDAAILLANLEATLKRYEELLQKAQGAPQILEIEREMSRVRTQLDRVKGDMQYLKDRATLATIYVTLSSPSAENVVEPTATLYPGVRGTSLVDFSDKSRTYFGGGLSVRFTRAFSLDADWMTRARNGNGVDLFIASAGFELYSDLLGGGRRKFLNPYLGFRVGYARIRGDGAVAPGGVLGVELWKSDFAILELDVRGYGLIGIEDTTHGAMQTTLGFNVAY